MDRSVAKPAAAVQLDDVPRPATRSGTGSLQIPDAAARGYGAFVELVATGRTAEVFAVDGSRLLKLDRPHWNGVSHFEAGVLRLARAAGLPVPEVFESVTVDGRAGIVLERVRGASLTEVLAGGAPVHVCAERFVAVRQQLQRRALAGLPDLTARLDDEIARSGLSADRRAELSEHLAALSEGQDSRVCHFDLHPDNILVAGDRWVVIDWLTAANGPPIADHARTLLLRADATDPTMRAFLDALRQCSARRQGFDEATTLRWVPVLAAARLAEGFDGPYADWLTRVALGEIGDPLGQRRG